MTERFEEIFWTVAEELEITEWYELFDSMEFDTVETRIAETFGTEVLSSEEYIEWYNQMAEDL